MMSKVRDIVREHGGDLYLGGRSALVPGPGHSRKDRSLSIRETDDGRVLFHSFSENSPPAREIMAYLGLEPGEGREVSREERARWRRQREEAERRQRIADQAFCASIWRNTLPFEGSLAEAYLWSRGLVLEGCADIRFHPAAPRAKPREEGDNRPLPPAHPAMVAVVRDRDGAPLGLHLTYVALDGTGKAFGDRSRLMFGSMRGGAVHLAPPGPELAIGEGIETCLAYHTRTGRPTWATLTTSQYASFELPRGVRRLVIAADGDKGGLTAAATLAKRLHRLCDVQIDPAPDGKDWADVLEGGHV